MKQTKNDRITLLDTWHETGKNLPAIRPQAAPQHAQRSKVLSVPTKQPQRAVQPDLGRITTATNRWLVDTLDNLMMVVEPVEVYGRIVLCKFIPHHQIDPVLPVPLVRLSGINGWLHKRAYRNLANLMMALESRSPWVDPPYFVRRGKRLGRILNRTIRPFLTPDEHRYYGDQIWESVTNPFRKDWRK